MLRPFLLLFSLALLAGCTAPQQDELLNKFTAFARDHAGTQLHFATLDDSTLAYLERPGSGPAVMLVHGFSANKDTWLAMIPELPSDWRIIVPDLAGHGETESQANASFLLTQQAERLHQLRSQLGIEKMHLVGNSMGGAISLIYAATYPEQVATLTLMDSAGMTSPVPSEYMQALSKGENPLIATDEASFDYRWNFVMSKRPPLVWPLRPALIRQTLAREAINRAVFADMIATVPLLEEQNFTQQLSKVSMPVLILWGEEDRVLDKSAIGEFQRYLPHATTVVYSGIGHLPMLEAPAQTAQDVQKLVASQTN